MLAVKHTKRFIKDESGMVLVFVAICLIAIIGMVALTFDLGRLMATQTDLQSYADNVALAAAGELDGGTDAISRATAAAAALIRDRQTFADGEQNLGDASDYSLRFLDGLPADDTASVDPYVTTDSGEAVLVEVTATPRTVFLPFARALATMLGATDPNENVGAVAIAGYTQFACDITPLMFCMPSGFTDLNSPVGKTILLRSGGQASAWGPGDFGFLDPSGAMVDPNGPCASLTGVTVADRTHLGSNCDSIHRRIWMNNIVTLWPGRKQTQHLDGIVRPKGSKLSRMIKFAKFMSFFLNTY